MTVAVSLNADLAVPCRAEVHSKFRMVIFLFFFGLPCIAWLACRASLVAVGGAIPPEEQHVVDALQSVQPVPSPAGASGSGGAGGGPGRAAAPLLPTYAVELLSPLWPDATQPLQQAAASSGSAVPQGQARGCSGLGKLGGWLHGVAVVHKREAAGRALDVLKASTSPPRREELGQNRASWWGPVGPALCLCCCAGQVHANCQF